MWWVGLRLVSSVSSPCQFLRNTSVRLFFSQLFIRVGSGDVSSFFPSCFPWWSPLCCVRVFAVFGFEVQNCSEIVRSLLMKVLDRIPVVTFSSAPFLCGIKSQSHMLDKNALFPDQLRSVRTWTPLLFEGGRGLGKRGCLCHSPWHLGNAFKNWFKLGDVTQIGVKVGSVVRKLQAWTWQDDRHEICCVISAMSEANDIWKN